MIESTSLPAGDKRRPRAARPLALRSEGQTFLQALGPNLSRVTVAQPGLRRALIFGEMSERKEGRGKGKGKKKDRGSRGKLAPSEGDPSPGECQASPSLPGGHLALSGVSPRCSLGARPGPGAAVRAPPLPGDRAQRAP